jgi:hypothetical protein
MEDRSMEAIATKHLVVLAYEKIEGDKVITVNCRDYDHYSRLPECVSVEGELFGKTGWNSDKCNAYYKTNMRLARSI